MNLNQLRLFYFVAKHGSVSAAAKELGVTQPAVSKGLARFQTSLRVGLLEIDARTVALTDAGEALFRIAEEIFGLEAAADDCVRTFRNEQASTIRIATTESFGAYHLPDIIERFRFRRPDVAISVAVDATDAVVADVADLSRDIGFVSDVPAHPMVLAKTVLTEELVLIAAPGHRLLAASALQLPAVAGEAMIMHEPGSTPRDLVDRALRAAGVTVAVPMETASTEAIKHAVRDGVGIAFVSGRAAERELAAGEVVQLSLTPPLRRSYSAIVHRHRHLDGALREFVKLLDRGLG